MNVKICLTNLFVGLLLIVSMNTRVVGQLQGTYTPGNTVVYPTLASIINALNTQGVSGHVVINLPAGFTENVPAGGLVIGSDVLNTGSKSLSAARTLTIRKTGSGANPKLTASTGTGSADAIFTIAGADYITIDGVDLAENSSNSTTAQQMEWGVAVLKRTTSGIGVDGCHNIAIRNCVITLNKSNPDAVGIYAGNHATGGVAALTPADPSGAHRNDTFANNTIRNVVRGISLSGYSAGAETLMDFGYVIENNTIENFGHAVAGPTVAPTGIYVTGCKSTLIGKNTINNTAGAGTANMAGILSGIHHGPAKGGYLRVWDNQITLVQDSTTNGSNVFGIRSEIGGAVSGGSIPQEENTLVITGNTISARGARNSAQFNLITHSGAIEQLNVSDNIFSNIHFNGQGNCYFISNTMNNAPSNSVIVIRNNRLAGVFRVNGLGASAGIPGQVILINNTGNIAGNALRDTIEGNDFSNFDATDGNPLKAQIIVGIQDNIGGASGPYAPKYISGNKFRNIAGVLFRGFNLTKLGAGATDTCQISHNLISNVHALNYGIQINNLEGQIAFIHDNTIDSSRNTGMNMTQTTAINIAGGLRYDVYNNRIGHLSVSHATNAPVVYGIHIRNGAEVNCFNNMIGYITAPESPKLTEFGVAGIYAERGDTIRIFHNTLYLVPEDAAKNDYNISGVLYTETSSKLDLRNNIVYVDTRPARGISAAVRRKSGDDQVRPFNLATTSNGNILYAPDVLNSYVYAENDSLNLVNAFKGVDINQLCGPYKVFLAPAESASFFEDNLSVDPNGNFVPTGNSFAKQRGVATGPWALLDIAGITRPSKPDAGAIQFVGTTIPSAGRPQITANGATTFCAGDSVALVVTLGTANGVLWQLDKSNIAHATDTLYFAKESGVHRAVLTYANGCADTSEEITVEVYPVPTPTITASGASGEILSTGTFASYQWQRDGNDIPGAQSQTYTATVPGAYSVVVVDANGCVGSSAILMVELDPSSVSHFSTEVGSRYFYPNPVKDILNLTSRDVAYVQIVSPTGQIVLQGRLNQSVNIGHLQSGVYLMRLFSDHGTLLTQEKVVVLK